VEQRNRTEVVENELYTYLYAVDRSKWNKLITDIKYSHKDME